MRVVDHRQLELFSDGARAVAARKRPPRPRPTEADLQARLDASRQRLHEIVILRMKTWVAEETRRGLREAEDWRRERVRFTSRYWSDFARSSAGAERSGTSRCRRRPRPLR
jgi:hypothetical protein